MPCTTILVGKNASYDGSTLMARNEDSGAGHFCPKSYVCVTPDKQPRLYRSVISGVTIELPEMPMRYTAMPNALPDKGIWGEAGFNEENIAMSETETITTNSRVLGADPLVGSGIGEEDMLTIVLPYIHSAREGVQRLGSLLEKYGTYEMNAIGFQDMDEIWWLESLGGHHWLAKRVPDDSYVVMPNQRGIDYFDFTDAFGNQKDHLCSADLVDFVCTHFMNLKGTNDPALLVKETRFDARAAFGTHSDHDHAYNTPRAWYIFRYLNPKTWKWEGPKAHFTPESDNLPWSMVPENKITIEDIKYILSSYYQGTPFNPYLKYGDSSVKGKYRPVGINRNNFVKITQLRPYVPSEIAAIEWIAEGSNAFNAAFPFYANVKDTPSYLRDTTARPTTENFYWVNRMIGALADAHYSSCMGAVTHYQNQVQAWGNQTIYKFDHDYMTRREEIIGVTDYLEACNLKIAEEAGKFTDQLLDQVLLISSNQMKNAYSLSDAQ